MILLQRMALVAVAGSLMVFSHGVGAQLTPNAESEQRSQAEALRQRLERGADVLLPKGAPLEATRLPEDESPCFKLTRIALKGADLARFGWLMDATAGPGGLDSPLHARSGKCIGVQGVALVIKRAQNALVAKGLGDAAVNRITATVDLAGGWQAFVDRMKVER